MDTEFDTKIQELAQELETFKNTNPEKYAELQSELAGHLEAIQTLLKGV